MVYLFLAEGFEDIEAVAVIDVLRRANISVETVSITENLFVVSAHGIKMEANITISQTNLSQTDMVVLPGGMPGTEHLLKNEGVLNFVRSAYEQGKYVAAICAAPSILGKINLLSGKKATCYPGFESQLTDAVLTNMSVVQDGKIITSKGPGTALDFAYKLVSVLKDEQISQEIRIAMQAPLPM